MDKKGFLFTVTVFLVLVYILLSISVWVKSMEASERTFSEFYKESTVELTIEQITDSKMDEVGRILMMTSLSRLDEHTLTHSVLEGPSGDENQEIERALDELVVSGYADGSHFKGGVGIAPQANSSFSAWAANLNASLKAIGVYVSEFEVTGFEMGQSDIDRVNYSMDVKVGLRDFANTSSVSRLYHLSNSVGVSGLVDPALVRESRNLAGDELTVYRQFFFNKDDYLDYSRVSVSRIASPSDIEGGQGWLYGPLARAGGTTDLVPNYEDVDASDRRVYILMGTYDELMALPEIDIEGFAGYIVTTAPAYPSNCSGKQNEDDTINPITYSGATCAPTMGSPYTIKPFIVAPGFDPSAHDIECPLLSNESLRGRCVLIQSSHLPEEVLSDPVKKLTTTGSGIYNVELLRDFVMCGYYTHNPGAPSFLQRLLNDSYSRTSTDYGIETFVIGVYANDTSYDTVSRLDREMFSGDPGIRVRGMPGCKNYASCSDSPTTGIFAVSAWIRDQYGLNGITCDNPNAAGCG
ncbi:MAG: hypothetical protein V1827_04225 [Candidatus Micrarchaeota archaeon]